MATYQNPYRNNDIAAIGQNLATAFFGDPNAKAQYSQAQADAAYKQQLLDLQKQEFGLKQNLNNAQIPKYQAETQKLQQDLTDAKAKSARESEIVDLITRSLVRDPNTGQFSFNQDAPAAIGRLLANNPSVNPENWMGALNPDPVSPIVASPGSEIMFPRDEQGLPTDPRDPAYASRFSNPVAEVPLPSFEGQQPSVAVTVPQGLADVIDIPAPNIPGRASNVYKVPDKKAEASFGTDNSRIKGLQTSDDVAMLNYNTAEKAKYLLQPGVLDKTLNPVGSIPGLATIFDIGQQQFGDPDAAAARQAYKEITQQDWLSKTQFLKGAISDAENRELQTSRPSDGASVEAKRKYLEKVAFVSDRASRLAQSVSDAYRNGSVPPDPIQFIQQYNAQNAEMNPFATQGAPAPARPAQQSGLPDMMSGGSVEASRGLTAEIAAQFLSQAGGDKEKARAMARQAGYQF